MVYDPVGGQHNTDENLRALIAGRRLVVIGFADGHVRPIVGAVYRFDEAGRALADLEGRPATGKLVLRVKESDR
jgi:prepilin-type processing-associated H-X9-DG protein